MQVESKTQTGTRFAYRHHLQNNFIWVLLILTMCVAWFANPRFLSTLNLSNILLAAAPLLFGAALGIPEGQRVEADG